MLMVAVELLVHLHLRHHAVLAPASTGNHPAERRAAVSCERKIIRSLTFQIEVPPEQFQHEHMRLSRRLAFIFISNIRVIIIA